MKKPIWIPRIAIGILLFGSFAGMVTAGVAVFRHGDADDRAIMLHADDSREATKTAIIEVDAFEYDLGVVDSSRACAHVFEIRNVGDGPLYLRRGSTTCSCTMSEVPSGPIPPGGSAKVRVSSDVAGGKAAARPGDPVDGFSHGATVFTNDPDNPSVNFWLRGIVRTSLAASPARFEFPRLDREETRSTSVVVFSQSWDAFAIDDVEASRDDLTWKIEPAAPAELGELHARSGFRVEVTTPATLAGGSLDEWLEVTVVPESATESAQSMKLAVVGDVAQSVTVHGQKLLGGKVLWLGSIRQGQRVEGRLLMKVRDEHRRVEFKRIRTTPEYLEVSIHPSGSENEGLGLYTIDVAVPADAPAGSYMGARRGQIRIETDHPELPVLQLDVEYAVTGA